jgi:hypothetical protein
VVVESTGAAPPLAAVSTSEGAGSAAVASMEPAAIFTNCTPLRAFKIVLPRGLVWSVVFRNQNQPGIVRVYTQFMCAIDEMEPVHGVGSDTGYRTLPTCLQYKCACATRRHPPRGECINTRTSQLHRYRAGEGSDSREHGDVTLLPCGRMQGRPKTPHHPVRFEL